MDESHDEPPAKTPPPVLGYRPLKGDRPPTSIVQTLAGTTMVGFTVLVSAVCVLGGVAAVTIAWCIIGISFAMWSWELWYDPEGRGLAIGIWIGLGVLASAGVLLLTRL